MPERERLKMQPPGHRVRPWMGLETIALSASIPNRGLRFH